MTTETKEKKPTVGELEKEVENLKRRLEIATAQRDLINKQFTDYQLEVAVNAPPPAQR